MDYERVMAILRAFEREGVAYTIIGGVAMNVQGLARGTRDLDIFVRHATVRPRDQIDAAWLRKKLDDEGGP